MRRRKGEQLLDEQLKTLDGYIQKVAQSSSRFSVLYSQEDLVQEASVVLWKVVRKYPKAKPVDLVRIFKTSLNNRLSSLFRTQQVKEGRKMVSLDGIKGKVELDIQLDLRFVGSARSITPWDFYKRYIRMLERRYGWKFVRMIINRRDNPKDFRRFKEELMKNG